MRTLCLLGLLAACSDAAPPTPPAPRPVSAPASEPTTLGGADFTVPVPQGFRQSPVAAGPDSVALLEKQRLPGEGSFLGSIVINRVPAESSDCATIAAKTGRMAKLTVGQVSEQPECQFEASDPGNPHRALLFTLRRQQDSLWMITCSFDPADAPARQGCQALKDGWRWTTR